MKTIKRLTVLMMLIPVLFWTGCLYNENAATSQATPEAVFTLRLMHVNDVHSHLEEIPASLILDGEKTYLTLGGMGRLAYKVKKVRGEYPQSLLLCAGDAVQGTLYFPTHKGKAEADFMNHLGFDAMVLGNHEFDKGSVFTRQFASEMNYPVLAANMIMKTNGAGVFKPYTIKKVGGEEVAIIGLITPETATISNAGPYVVFNDEIKTAQQMIAKIEEQGINKIIVLSHLGYGRDMALAKAVPGIDVIVGGHTHTLLGDFSSVGMKASGPYPTVIMNPENEPVYIVQAWDWAKGLGILDVKFDREGEVVQCGGRFTLLAGDDFLRKNASGKKTPVSPEVKQAIMASIQSNPEIEATPKDPEAMALLAKYSQGVEAYRHQVVAKVGRDLLNVRIPGSAHPETGEVLKQGSMVAPLIAQSMLDKCRSVGQNVQLSILNAGGARTDVQAGPLTVADVYNLLPFGNTVYVLDLSGEEIRRAIEEAVDQAFDPVKPNAGGFPYLAGGRFDVFKDNAPGQRVFGLEYMDDAGKWTPINEGETYKVAVNGFMAHGGDGYSILAKSKGERLDTGFVDAEVFMEYAKSRRVLQPLPYACVEMK
ncbi:5'-Nucleotidase domain protein [Desulfatibacillum aliphaticivorans]|uniref:5'-Nucleotidase domain protein n=1 Tax=Desulfatibacillum aliphaticivorans TaxID=218208 RepID=B8FEH4_DESAL|nr:5'-nucleotidase C-terminal domain-containing protein [Desulfatibacillum aliphaticivorans]ACL06955.1 5'-Nucleotidase domain protein [Desulfatibacillum aliphaticivorans]